ncbi:MAG: helix-turn-helix transcriptional regulator [Clostridium perfringens]|nr:helix-turn-helix transcriptional regulator [Clostridium perfringens]
MDREILKGSLEIILLSLLKNNVMYGYEISKTIKNLSEDALIIEEGTLYPALKRLEEKGLIKHYFVEFENSKKKRKYYEITEEGKRELDLKLKDFSLIEKLIKSF